MVQETRGGFQEAKNRAQQARGFSKCIGCRVNIRAGVSIFCFGSNGGLRFHGGVFELFKNGTGIIRSLLERIKNAVTHFNGCLEGGFFAAVLAVGEIFGELVPLAADTESPALKGCCLVRVACDVSLGHIRGIVCCVHGGAEEI